MATKFDNLEDVRSKFMGTICMYNGHPVLVKDASVNEEGAFTVLLQSKNKAPPLILLSDPLFNYTDFHIGYANTFNAASWWYRKPIKQYQQGLKRSQLGYKLSKDVAGIHDELFGFTKPYLDMLTRIYPPPAAVMKILRNQEMASLAFHQDYALSYDPLHNDFRLEYRGHRIGITSDLVSFKLNKDFEHLKESLQEVLNYVHK